MMERNGILLAGKRVLFTIVIGLVCSLSLSADYKLVLTDVDGNQTEECVKSYSFSNNLESIARQKGVANDVYSDEEVMTNKVYFGKPVYRKVVTIPTNFIGDNKWHSMGYINPAENIEKLIFAKKTGLERVGASSSKIDAWEFSYILSAYELNYKFGNKVLDRLKGAKVALEYTKTTDLSNSSPNKFQSYLIYKLSSTTNEDVTTKNMKNLGVQILEGYSYDSSTSSCTKK